MKSFTAFTIGAILITVFCVNTHGQILFTENFDYPAGDTLSHLGWEQIRNGDSLIVITEPGLTYDGYSLSGIGNAIAIWSDGGQEVRQSFAPQTSDSVYMSFLINVTDAMVNTVSADGLFLYLTPADGSIFSIRTSVYVRKHESSNLLAFGVSKGSGIQFTDYQYSLGTTFLIIVKYKFDTENADVVSFWINPEMTQTEPTAQISLTVGSDIPEMSNIIISQLIGSNEPPDAIIDGIKISTRWNDIPSAMETNYSKPADEFILNQNYPNPFNPSTTISYSVGANGHSPLQHVELSIYNTLGQKVAALVNKTQSAGSYQIKWNAGGVSSGVYLYRLQAGNQIQTKKMILMR